MNDTSNGADIRQWRVENKMTQRQFAGIIGVTEQTISNWEQERRGPCLSAARKLQEVTGLDFVTRIFSNQISRMP